MLAKLINQEEIIKYIQLYFKRDQDFKFPFNEYRSLIELFKAIYYRSLSIKDAESKQDEFMSIFNALEKYRPRNLDYVTARKNLLINAKKIYDGREMIINVFKDKIFPLNPEEGLFEDEDVHRGDEDNDEDENNLDDLDRAVVINDEMIDKELFKQYFDYESLNEMPENLYTKEGTPSNKTTADMIRNKLSNFRRNVIRMTPEEIAAERPFKTMNTVARILDFNK